MKAMVLTGVGATEIRDIDEPLVKCPGDVKVRVRACGICGSDVHYYTAGRIGGLPVIFPWIAGHEAAGEVVEVGPGVTGLTPGDRVAIEPAISCGKCDQCLAGRPNTCREISFLSCPEQAEGCFCEFVVVPERNCIPVPAGLTFEQAAMGEPLSIALYAAQKSIPLAGARVGILGAGPIGLAVQACVNREKPGALLMTEKIAERIAVARDGGVDWVGNPDREDVVSAILEREPEGLDVVFECCGEQEGLDQAFKVLKPGGKLMIVGIPETDRVSFDADLFRRNELTAFYVRRANNTMEPALQMMADHSVDAGRLITHRFDLEEAHKGFELLSDYADGVVKAMVMVSA